MKTVLNISIALALSVGASVQSARAEESSHSMHGMDQETSMQMDHSGHDMPGMDHGTTATDPEKKEKKPARSGHSMPGMDHSGHDMGNMEQGSDQATGAKDQKMDHGGHSMPGMDHGQSSAEGGHTMGSMQGGKAPADARDPHEHSGGYTLSKGPYVLPPANRLRLADEHNFASLWVDRLEAVQVNGQTSAAYEMQAWFGKDYSRAVLKAEGHVENGALEEGSTELLWSKAVSSFWNRQIGVRTDGGQGPTRNWLAFGYQGLAPFWFEVDATAYLGEDGRTALGLEAEYELMLTQKWVLQLSAEADLYGKDDPAAGIGPGLSEIATGVRLAYEFKREFATYVGVEWAGKFGGTADYAIAGGGKSSATKAVAGIRFWL